jgi:hypothetical protein
MSARTVFGVVGADGGAISGSEFISQQVGTGVYSIAFDPEFSSTPAVIAAQGGNFGEPDPLDGAAVGDLSPAGFTLTTGNQGGSLQNRQFSFIARG